jgi:hypothetical protein
VWCRVVQRARQRIVPGAVAIVVAYQRVGAALQQGFHQGDVAALRGHHQGCGVEVGAVVHAVLVALAQHLFEGAGGVGLALALGHGDRFSSVLAASAPAVQAYVRGVGFAKLMRGDGIGADMPAMAAGQLHGGLKAVAGRQL